MEIGQKVLVTELGKSYWLEFQRYQYDQCVFTVDESQDIPYYWCNTMGGRKGGTFSGKTHIMIPFGDLRQLLAGLNPKGAFEINDWAISKMVDVHISKASQKNINAILNIAKSMMTKNKVDDDCIEYVARKLKEHMATTVDIKQFQWESVLESQVKQLPF